MGTTAVALDWLAMMEVLTTVAGGEMVFFDPNIDIPLKRPFFTGAA